MDRICIETLHDRYFETIKKKEELIKKLSTTKYPKKIKKEIEKLKHIVPFDDYILNGSYAVTNYIEEKDEQQKDWIYSNYLQTYYPDFDDKFRNNCLKIREVNSCECGGEMKLDLVDSVKACVECGECIEYQITRYTWDVEQQYSYSKPSYQKIKTMVDWLELFLARNSKDLPEGTVALVSKRLERMEKKHITVEIIQKTLKELKLNSLYKYIYFIYSKVTDIVPVIDEEKEKELYSVFARVQDSFNRLKQTGALGRKNIWVYRYCVYKICEIIEEKVMIKYIPKPLVDGHKNLYKYDQGWKLVMEDLGLPFYSSI